MTTERHDSELRLVAVFLMGLSVGISLMLVYVSFRTPQPPSVYAVEPAEADSR